MLGTYLNPLQRARVTTPLSQRDVASKLGVGRTTIIRWEADSFDPSGLPLSTLEALAALYGIPVPDLLGRSTDDTLPAAAGAKG